MTNYYGHIHTNTRPCACSKSLASTLIHTCLDMFTSIPQLSVAFILPYLQLLDSPHVSLYFQTTKRLRGSSLDLSALPSLIETQLPLSFSLCRSVNQSARQSVHSQAPHTGHSCPFTKIKHPGRNIQWREAKKQRSRGEQSVILGSVCEAAWLVWSLESGSLLCVAHVGRARE